MNTLSTRSIYKIPFEIWHMIFTDVLIPNASKNIVPPNMRPIDETLDPEDIELVRIKKTLRLVMPVWRDVATEFLFHRVEIRDIAKAVRLVDVLQHSSDSATSLRRRPYGSCISFLWLEFYIPKNWHKLYIRYISRLVELCPNLSTFILVPVISALNDDAPGLAVPNQILQSLVTWPCGKSLRSLTFRGAQSPTENDVSLLFSHCPNLEEFISTQPYGNITSWPTSQLGHVGLRHLNVRHVSELLPFQLSPNFPSLTHLSYTGPLPSAVILETFFDTCGPRLTSLFWSNTVDDVALEKTILPRCPNLTSLGYEYGSTSPSNLRRPCPSVRHVWIYNFGPRFLSDANTDVRHFSGTFPNLKSIILADTTVGGLDSTYKGARSMRLEWISRFVELSLPFLDRNGEAITTAVFGRRRRAKEEVDDADHEAEEPLEYSTDTSFTSSSEEALEDIDSDFARHVEDTEQVYPSFIC
jgi:hypothetical protein